MESRAVHFKALRLWPEFEAHKIVGCPIDPCFNKRKYYATFGYLNSVTS